MHVSRREFARLSLTAGLGGLLSACQGRGQPPPAPSPAAEARPSVVGGSQRYQEAPMLAEQVARGELPAVEECLPAAPYVLEVNESVGVYGGAWRRAYRRDSLSGNPNTLYVKNGLTQLDRDLTVKPYIAESWELDEAGTTITWHLRRGMRWSNGDPVTSEDFEFYWLAGLDHPEIGHYGLERKARIEVINDHAVSLWLGEVSGPQVQPVSYADQRSYPLPLVPAAFAKQYHPDYAEGGQAALEALARQGGYASWDHMYRAKVHQSSHYYDEPDKPTLLPWLAITRRRAGTVMFERNPYFWQVDAEGQQLPYLDHVVSLPYGGEVSLEMLVANGEVDCQVEGLLPHREEDYRLQGYGVRHFPSGEHIVLQFDPSTANRALAEFVSHREVRLALSVAINRRELSVLYGDLAEPRQYAPIKESPLYDEELAYQHLEYDPLLANQMLDAAGYAQRDEENYRLSPQGERLRVMLQSPYEPESAGGQLVARVLADLEALGLECTLLQRAVSEIYENHRHRALDACVTPLGGTLLPSVVVAGGFSTIGRANVWQGTEAVPDAHYFNALDDLYQEMVLEPDLERKNALFRELLVVWKRELPLIGLLGGFRQLGIAKEGFMNSEDRLVYDEVTNYEAFQNPQQFYWHSPQPHVLAGDELSLLSSLEAGATSTPE